MSKDNNKNQVSLVCHKVEQPIGMFYQTCMDWKTLKKIISFQKRMLVNIDDEGHEEYRNIQREISPSRQKEISRYILDDPYATFPSSIIINISSQEYISFRELNINHSTSTNLCIMDIEIVEGIAQVIDGQHRLSGFNDDWNDLTFNLPVSIFIDVTLEYQAEIFAIINGKQTRVSPSLVYDLFGLSQHRTPYKVVNDIIKMLNESDKSPIKHWIKILGSNNNYYKANITQSTIAKYLIKYISGNLKQADEDKRNIIAGNKITMDTPFYNKEVLFRDIFNSKDDVIIVTALINYFKAIKAIFNSEWEKDDNKIKKTVIFRAFLDKFEEFSSEGKKNKDLSQKFYETSLAKYAKNIDFNSVQLSSKGIKQFKEQFVSQKK